MQKLSNEMECFPKITLFLVCILFYQVIADSNSFRKVFCDDENGSYTTNSSYETNLRDVLSSMANDTKIDYGFYNFSDGQVNAIALCRGDLNLSDCRDCLSIATAGILQNCSNTNPKEAITYYDHCMLRYSERSIFGLFEKEPHFSMNSSIDATDQDKYAEDATNLIRRLQTLTASGNSTKKFVTGNVSSGSETIFALTQCTPDLSQGDCKDCLDQTISEMSNYKGKIGGRTYRPSCNLWYENFSFYEGGYDLSGNNCNRYRTSLTVVVPILGIVILML